VCDLGAGSRAIQCSVAIARLRVPSHHARMAWTTPSYDEIKMDAEIGSYQQDGENVPIAEREETAPAAAE
jgi:hypothetical protein